MSTSLRGLVEQHKVGSARHFRLDSDVHVHRREFGDSMIRRDCEVRGAEESDGGEAGIVLRRGDEAERGQDEVGADEGEQGESAQARGGRAAMIFLGQFAAFLTPEQEGTVPRGRARTKLRDRRFRRLQRS